MFEGLFSSEAQFTRGFTAIAHHGAAAASLLRDALSDRSKRTASITAIKHLVRESGATAHDLRVRVARTLVTPLDREDLGLLVSRLEGVLRSVERSAGMTQALHIDRDDAAAIRLADTLTRATEALEAAVSHLPDAARVTAEALEVKRLEEEGDAIFGEAMSALFGGNPDALEALRWKEIYGALEDTLDTCAHAAGMVEGLSLKRL